MTKSLFWKSKLLANHGFTGIFSLRNGGFSTGAYASLNLGHGLGDLRENVEKNLSFLINAAGLNGRPHQARQIHGTGILMCDGPGKIHEAAADILLSFRSGMAVSVRVADCLPILLADPDSGMVAAVHAGWRGTSQNIASKAVRAMRNLGAKAGNILAALGPCIGPCCFTLQKETWQLLRQCSDNAKSHPPGKEPYVADLAAINMVQLSRAGLLPSHIDRLQACTSCQTASFFSYRRDNGKTGRHLAIVGCSTDA